MTTLTANAVIQAVDRFSGPIGRMAGALGAFGARAGVFQKSMQRLGTASTGVAGLGTSFMAGYFLKSQFDFEQALNRTQAILDITRKEQFKPLRDEIVRLAEAYPAMRTEIAKGSTEMAMAGMKMKTIQAVLEGAIRGSMASGESIKIVAEGVTDVIMSMALPFKTAAEQAASFARVNNILAAGATSYNQTYTAFLSGLSKTGPVARAAGVDLTTVVAMLGALANAGIKAERGGTGLASLMLRLGAPTKKARAEIRALGIDLTKFQHFTGKFQNMGGKTLAERLKEELGLSDVDGLIPGIDHLLKDKKLTGNATNLTDALTQLITSKLGTSAGDAESRAKIQDAVSRFVRSSFSTVDVLGLMRAFAAKDADRSLPFLNEVAGKYHSAKLAAILSAIKDGHFDAWLKDLTKKIPGATDRFAQIMMQGFVGAVYRMASAWDAFLDRLANTGVLDTVTNIMTRVTQAIGVLAQTNPRLLELSTYAVLAAGALAPIGFALAGIVAGAAALLQPILWVGVGLGAVAYGAYKLYENWELVKIGLAGILEWAKSSVLATLAETLAGPFKAMLGVLSAVMGAWHSFVGSIESGVERILAAFSKLTGAMRAISGVMKWAPGPLGLMFRGLDALGKTSGSAPATGGPSVPSTGAPLIRDLNPTAGPRTIDVTGKVHAEGSVTGKVQVDITVRDSAGRPVERKSTTGDLRGPLKTGRTMPDVTGPAAGGPR